MSGILDRISTVVGLKNSSPQTDSTNGTGVDTPVAARTICICIDTTASMGQSLQSVKDALRDFRRMFELLNVKVSVLFYGDYTDKNDDNVTRLVFVEPNKRKRDA